MRHRRSLFLLALALPIFFSFPHGAFAALALDGSAYADTTYGQASTSTALTTTQANDVIIVEAFVGNNDTITSVSDTAGLAWQRRIQYINSGNNGVDMEEWYATSSSPLSADAITVTASNGTGGLYFDAFGVSGANTSIPLFAASPVGSSSGGSVSLSTYDEPAMVIGFGDDYDGGTCTAGSGYTLINGSGQTLEYAIEPTSQSGVSVTVGSCAGATDTTIADAIAPFSASPLLIDGENSIDNSMGGLGNDNGSPSITLTTAAPNDIIVVQEVNATGFGGAPAATISSISDTAGLTWRQRTATSTPDIDGYSYDVAFNTEVWWAYAPSPLSSDTITATMTGNTADIDCIGLAAFGVNGANTSNPWDTNTSLPAAVINDDNNAIPSVSPISTNAADTMLLGFLATPEYSEGGNEDGGSGDYAVGSGYTQIAYNNIGSCADAAQQLIEYKVASSSQSNAAISFSATAPISSWVMIGDAIQAASQPAPSTGRIIRIVGGTRLVGGIRLE